MDLLDRLRQGWHEPVEVVEHEPPGELVTPVDIVRVDDLGRHVVVVPAGTVPHSRVALSAKERDALIEPSPRPPQGHWHANGYGLSLEGVVIGEYEGGGLKITSRTTPGDPALTDFSPRFAEGQ